MDLRTFLNCAKILRSIDQDELVAAGVSNMSVHAHWRQFTTNPVAYLISTDDDVAALIWDMVEKRAGGRHDDANVWSIDYEHAGYGATGTMYLTAPDVLTVCQDFDRFWKGRQEIQGLAEYFGALYSVKVIPWGPWAVGPDGNLVRIQAKAAEGLEWKIDGSGAGFAFGEYAEAMLEAKEGDRS